MERVNKMYIHQNIIDCICIETAVLPKCSENTSIIIFENDYYKNKIKIIFAHALAAFLKSLKVKFFA